MNAEEILTRTFADHQDEAPDPEAVLADVHARLARRRRIIPVLAAAATVAAIAIGAIVLAGQRPAPAPPSGPAVPTVTGPSSTPRPDPTPRDPLSAVPLAEAARSTVAVETTWLPPGSARTTALMLSYGRQLRTYDVTGPDQETVRVDLEVRAGSALTTVNADGAPSRDLTIGGRPAREFSQDRHYVVVERLPGDRVAEIRVQPMPNSSIDLAAAGRRIAASLRFDRPEPVSPAYRLTYVPKGLVVREVGRSDALGGTEWGLSRPRAPDTGPWVALGEDTRPGTSSSLPQPVVAGRTVQGHPTHLVTQAGNQVALYVDRFVGGNSLTINVTDGLVPVAELYRIADGVRLVG